MGHQQRGAGRVARSSRVRIPVRGEQVKPNEQALTGGARLRVIVALEQGLARAAQTVR
jgi:hypothetical protein